MARRNAFSKKEEAEKRVTMDTLRSTAHLQREIGDTLFDWLISSDNTDIVRKFVQKCFLPTEMDIGERTYDILNFLLDSERSVTGQKIVERAKDMDAHLGEEDAQYILDHQKDIPVALRGKVFMFTDWTSVGGDHVYIYSVCWSEFENKWTQSWDFLGDNDHWLGVACVLRRKPDREGVEE